MTILETFIKLRDDFKLWVSNNLKTKADISYVDDEIEMAKHYSDVNTMDLNVRIDGVIGQEKALPSDLCTMVDFADAINNDPQFAVTIENELAQKSQVQMITWEDDD